MGAKQRSEVVNAVWMAMVFSIVWVFFSQVATAQIPKSVISAATNTCLVTLPLQNGFRGYGTGCFLGKSEGAGIVVTAAHVVRGRIGPITCRFPSDSQFESSATVISEDPTYDIAILKLSQSPNLSGVTFAEENPQLGQTLYAYGYPHGTETRWSIGRVVEFNAPRSGLPPDWAAISSPSIGGQSGGPVFTETGAYVGNLWGSDHTSTALCSTGRTQLFLGRILEPLRRWRAKHLNQHYGCPGGQCQPHQPGPQPRPSTPLDPVKPPSAPNNSAAIANAAEINRLKEELARVNDQLTKLQNAQQAQESKIVNIERNTAALLQQSKALLAAVEQRTDPKYLAQALPPITFKIQREGKTIAVDRHLGQSLSMDFKPGGILRKK